MCYTWSIENSVWGVNMIWKDIKGYEGKYQISNLRVVKTIHKNYIKVCNFKVWLLGTGVQKEE